MVYSFTQESTKEQTDSSEISPTLSFPKRGILFCKGKEAGI
jgi:hypothetical protein